MARHLTEEELSVLLDKEIGAEEQREFERHLEDCDRCRAAYDEISGVDLFFRGSRPLEPSPFLWTRLRAELDSATPPARSRWLAWFPAPLPVRVAAGALALVIAIVSAVAVREERSRRNAAAAAIAEIDRGYQASLPRDPDLFNPFRVVAGGPDANPFREIRARNDSQPSRPISR